MPARLGRLSFHLLRLVLGLLAAVWTLGYALAPRHYPTLASVRLGQVGDETKLSGARFACGWDAARAAQRCVGSLEDAALTLRFSPQACSAQWRGRRPACHLDYGAVPGLPSVRIDAPPLRTRRPSLAALVDYVGTLSECEWAFVAQVTLLTLLFGVAVVVWTRVSSRLMRCVYLACAVASTPVWLLALFLWTVHMGYAD